MRGGARTIIPPFINITVDNKDLRITLRKSKRASKLSLHISGKLYPELVIPSRVSFTKAMSFVEQNKNWLAENIARQPKATYIRNGITLPILGEKYKVKFAGSNAGITHFNENEIIVYAKPGEELAKLKLFLKKHLLQNCEIITREKVKLLNTKHGPIKIRDMTSCWGTCHRNGTLTFAFNLLFAPYSTLEYLVSHEVSHLKENGHTKKFWNLVESICPGFEEEREYLKQNGYLLSGYLFE